VLEKLGVKLQEYPFLGKSEVQYILKRELKKEVKENGIPLMGNSKEISVLNATKLSGNVLNADSSSLLQYPQTHAHNAIRSAIS